MLSLSQQDLLTLLTFLVTWIRDYGLTDRIALWLFSVLSCVRKPLTADAYHVLRQVSRAVSSVRRDLMQLDDEHEEEESRVLTAAHLLICLIGRYFQQLDMIDQ